MIMRKQFELITMSVLIALASFSVGAQTPDKKAEEKPKGSQIDAWHEALPHTQANAMPDVYMAESTENVEVAETPAQIEKRILEMEGRLLEALKARDSATLQLLIADELLLGGLNLPGKQTDKERYIDWVKNKYELKSYTIEDPVLRVFPRTVLVTYKIKRQATVGGAPADGDFTVTDVWVLRSKRWQAVSHHILPVKL